MDFSFDAEQLALRDALATLCGHHFALGAIATRERRAAEASAWQALADIGALGMLVPADRGGSGGGVVEAAIVSEQLGAHLGSGPTVWSMSAAPLLPEVATGAVRVAGLDLTSTHGGPFVVEHAAESDIVAVVHADRVESVHRSALGPMESGEPLDPLTPTAVITDRPVGAVIGDSDAARRLRLLGTVLTAAQLVGAAQGALDVASAYALERRQFGVPIGSFQAIKHLLADMFVRVGLARATTYAAAALLDAGSTDEAVTTASSAKVLAGEAGLLNGRTAVQVLGGMGFTWEMLPHYFLKRAWVLDASFDTTDTHALTLAATIA